VWSKGLCRREYDRQRRADPEHSESVSLVKRKPADDMVSLLCRVLRGSANVPGASCVTNPEAFNVGASPSERALAKRVCQSCPALDACRDWLATRPNAFGTIAGEYRERPKWYTQESA
jgi:hypothetical protein